jgi:hypothetical protein
MAENKDGVSDDFRPLITAFLVHWNKAHRNITNKMKHGQERSRASSF